MYNKVNEQDISVLRSIVGEADVFFGDAINPDYAHDELGGISRMPEVLVRVHSTEQVSAIMRHAWERTLPVTVRGSGTGLVGAAVPIEGGILLETTRMNKILALDENNLTVTVAHIYLNGAFHFVCSFNHKAQASFLIKCYSIR